jgi:hypothetical protein
MKPLSALLLLSLALLPSPVAGAAKIVLEAAPTSPIPADETTILISGIILAGDANRFLFAVEGHTIITARLNSPGGYVPDAVQMAEWIKSHRIATEVEAGATCTSSCFIIFAAGTKKFAGAGARIGVHAVKQAPDGAEMPAQTVKLARLLQSYQALKSQHYRRAFPSRPMRMP